MSKSPSVVLHTYAKCLGYQSLQQHSLLSSNLHSESSASRIPPRVYHGPLIDFHHPKRYYATVRDDKPKTDETKWPRLPSVNIIPTSVSTNLRMSLTYSTINATIFGKSNLFLFLVRMSTLTFSVDRIKSSNRKKPIPIQSVDFMS